MMVYTVTIEVGAREECSTCHKPLDVSIETVARVLSEVVQDAKARLGVHVAVTNAKLKAP